MMDTVSQLNREFSAQDFSRGGSELRLLDRCRAIAENYARMEHAIAVLSDLQAKVSYIYYGAFACTLGIGRSGEIREVSSIWEEEIFRMIHPDDLARKHLQELCFFHFVKRQPRKKRSEYHLISKLRMRIGTNAYMPVLHRMFYVSTSSNETQWLALCLYSPLFFDIPASYMIVNSTDGHIAESEALGHTKILSSREKQILRLIDRGLTSKEIAAMLCISVNTVSRHRQEILSRLRVKNSIEACRMAKDLKLF